MKLASIFHSKTVQSLSGWFGVISVGYLAIAFVLAWLSKITPEWFGPLTWSKAILIGLFAAVLLFILLAAAFFLIAQAYRLVRPWHQRTESVDTLLAHGTVRDVPLAEQLTRGLYVAKIEIDVGRLQSDHVVEIAIFGFNGTNKVVSFSRVTGNIALSISGAQDVAFQLSPPSILAHRSNPDAFPDFTEFLLVFEQSLRPGAVEWLAENLPNHRILFDLDQLDVMIEVRGEGASARLPIWNGATVHREDGYRTHRLHRLHVEDVVIGSASSSPHVGGT
jgi:hypothetical protein